MSSIHVMSPIATPEECLDRNGDIFYRPATADFQELIRQLDHRFRKEYEEELGLNVEDLTYSEFTQAEQMERYAKNLLFWKRRTPKNIECNLDYAQLVMVNDSYKNLMARAEKIGLDPNQLNARVKQLLKNTQHAEYSMKSTTTESSTFSSAEASCSSRQTKTPSIPGFTLKSVTKSADGPTVVEFTSNYFQEDFGAVN